MRVMSIGTVMVDILAVGLDAVADPGTVVYAPSDIESRIGGHPIDVGIDLVKLGADPTDVAVVAAIGTGMYGEFARAEMERYGLTNALLQLVADRDTGRNLVLEVKGEDRRFHIDPGANWLLDPDHVVSTLTGWAPDLVTIRPGYSGIDNELDIVVDAMRDALVLLDIMQAHPARPDGYLDAALARADIVHANEVEAPIATGAVSVDEAVARFLERGVALALITNSADGATAYTPTHQITQPGLKVEVVDATGAGDAFCAGLVFGLTENAHPVDIDAMAADDLARLLLTAQATGASAATAVGCVEGVSAHLVARIIDEQGEQTLRDTTIQTT